MMSNSGAYTLVYILGTGHCGSTLLNMLLNAHSKVIGLSEVSSLGIYAQRSLDEEGNPLSSTFWHEVERRYKRATGNTFQEARTGLPENYAGVRSILLNTDTMMPYVKKNKVLLDCIAEVSQASILIDSSKKWQRLFLLQKAKELDLRVIHLVRDGRAVTNSYLKKYGDLKFAISKVLRSGITAYFMKHKFPKHRWLLVQYEALASSPVAVLQEVCQFIGADYEEGMLDYRQAPYEGLGGNRMARTRADENIRLDQAWKTEMTVQDLTVFTLFAGWLNKLQGY